MKVPLPASKELDFTTKEWEAIQHVGQTLDLDKATRIRTIPSAFGSDACGAIHDLEIVAMQGSQYWLKAEEVYCDSRRVFEYQSFLRFVESLFITGDGMVTQKCIPCKHNLGEVEICFPFSLVEGNREFIEQITDETNPESIKNQDLKHLFIHFLSRKKQLIRENGILKDKVYSQEGRDVINETLASALGNLLGVPVPQNYLARRKKNFYYPYRKETPCLLGYLRFTASKDLSSHGCVNLAEYLIAKSSLEQGKELQGAFDFNWHFSNPLSLESLLSKDPLIKKKVRFAQKWIQSPQDLVASDFLDHFLGGSRDRKLQEYLITNQQESETAPTRIYTIDFGEILFPEIQYSEENKEFQKAKDNHCARFQAYLEQASSEDLPTFYREEVGRMLATLAELSEDFFLTLIHSIPDLYLACFWDDATACYKRESLTALFLGLQQIAVEANELWLEKELKAQYYIPKEKKLLIIDAHDTIFKRDFSREVSSLFLQPEEKESVQWTLREGFINFLIYYHDILGLKIVISSDGGKMKLREMSKKFGIFQRLEKIYGSDHMDRETYLKRLDLILEEMNISKEDALFIGDGRIDELSCKKYGVDFIKVPDTVSGRWFSFNLFFHLGFNENNFALELQGIDRVKKVHHNLSTAKLIEHIILKGEGSLGHLGPVVVNYKESHETPVMKYIVKDPFSEEIIDWGGEYQSFGVEEFEQLNLQLIQYLKDQELYISDCFSGPAAIYQIPLRIFTQTAWHGLFVRNMFPQLKEKQMKGFFPEYTLFFIPDFIGFPSPSKSNNRASVVINLVKKTVIVSGTVNPEYLREAVFALLSVILPLDDIIPIRCAANRNESGELSIFIGKVPPQISLKPSRFFLGDDCHGWAKENFFNMEWGCLMPIKGLSAKKNPFLYQSTRKFGTLLLQTALDQKQRLSLTSRETLASAQASFPLAHFPHADRSGVSALPSHLFLFIKDPSGTFPPFAKLSIQEAVLHLLLGNHQTQGQQLNLLGSRPFTFTPEHYASLLLERLKNHPIDCYMINLKPNPYLSVQEKDAHLNRITKLVHKAQSGAIIESDFTSLPLLGLKIYSTPTEGLIPSNPDNNQLQQQIQTLKRLLTTLEGCKKGLARELQNYIKTWGETIEEYEKNLL